MGKIGKLIAGLVFFIIGILIAYAAVANNLIDIILILGIVVAVVGIVMIITYFIDSSADKTRSMFKEHVKNLEERSNINLPNLNLRPEAQPTSTPNRPLKIRKEFDYYDEEFYSDDDDGMIYVQHDDDYEEIENDKRVLTPRNLDEETADFGNSLNFTPNYEKPSKIARAPKKRAKSFFDDDIMIEPVEDKSDYIQQALMADAEEAIPDLRAPQHQQQPARDIKIDINNPDSLPIPKMLNSFVISNDEIISTEVAFDRLGEQISKEVMLEIPSLNDLSDRFLSHIPTIYSRVIIQDFDVSNIAYMILVASLLKQGVQIRTMTKVNTINFIADDSRALILSHGRGGNDVEYGAIYTDRGALSEIRASFEKSWEMAKELDQDVILRYMEAEA